MGNPCSPCGLENGCDLSRPHRRCSLAAILARWPVSSRIRRCQASRPTTPPWDQQAYGPLASRGGQAGEIRVLSTRSGPRKPVDIRKPRPCCCLIGQSDDQKSNRIRQIKITDQVTLSFFCLGACLAKRRIGLTKE
jgi:hypothetical protein